MEFHIQRTLNHHHSEVPRMLNSLNTFSCSALRASKILCGFLQGCQGQHVEQPKAAPKKLMVAI